MRDIIQGTLDSINKAIDEADKTASVKRIERVLGAIDPKILEAEVIDGLEDLRDAIRDYRAITREGMTPEEYQEEKGSAFEVIQEAVDGVDINEDALESLEAPNPSPQPLRQGKVLSETMTVERKGSTIVGTMAWETPLIEFVSPDGHKYLWVSNTIDSWESGAWPKYDARRGHKFDLRKGHAVHVKALVRPDGKTLYRVTLSESLPAKTKREQIMEFDYAHTLNELKRMAKEKGVSPSGTKHAIIARLI